MDKETPFVKALGKVPSGIFIVTTEHEGKLAGYLASFVQQVSFEPLVFAIACHPDRYPYSLISKSKKFAINVLPEGDSVLMKAFAKGHGPEDNPFIELDHDLIESVPVLKDALGAAVFEVTEEVCPGDHVVFFGKAVDGTFFDETKKPWVHVRKSALSY